MAKGPSSHTNTLRLYGEVLIAETNLEEEAQGTKCLRLREH